MFGIYLSIYLFELYLYRVVPSVTDGTTQYKEPMELPCIKKVQINNQCKITAILGSPVTYSKTPMDT